MGRVERLPLVDPSVMGQLKKTVLTMFAREGGVR
jgi:hypothetical protein